MIITKTIFTKLFSICSYSKHMASDWWVCLSTSNQVPCFPMLLPAFITFMAYGNCEDSQWIMTLVTTNCSLSPNHESYQLLHTSIVVRIMTPLQTLFWMLFSCHVSALLKAHVYLVTTQVTHDYMVTQSYMARPCTYFHFSLWRHFCHHKEKQSNHNGHMVASWSDFNELIWNHNFCENLLSLKIRLFMKFSC